MNDELGEYFDGFIGFSKSANLLSCKPVRQGDENGPPAARVQFECKAPPPALPPLSLDLDTSRRLAYALINVLATFDDSLALKLQSLIVAEKTWRKAVGLRVRLPRKMTPSRSRGCPTRPITEREVWQLICLLRNCSDHSVFLRFIGTPDLESNS